MTFVGRAEALKSFDVTASDAHPEPGSAAASKPSVLFVDQTGQLGGAELSLLDIATHWASDGTDRCAVVLFDDGPFREKLEAAGVPVEVLRLGLGLDRYKKAAGLRGQLTAGPAVMRQVARLRRRARRFDVVYTNTQKSLVIGALAGAFARRPVIWHLRDTLTAGHFSAANRRIVVTLANRLATRVVCNSRATADAFVQAGGRQDKVSVVYNGINAAPFDVVDARRIAAIRDELDAGDRFVVGVFGRLTEWKGQDVLVDAVEQIAEKEQASYRPIQLVVVGEALFTDEDRAFATTLRDRSTRGALAGRVKFMGFRDDVPAVMKACDTIVHCSTQPEPFGRVIVEGMLAGRPVIASNAGGAREIITDSKTGLLTPPGDADALARSIMRLRADTAFADRLATAGNAEARERFTVESMIAGVEEAITRDFQRAC